MQVAGVPAGVLEKFRGPSNEKPSWGGSLPQCPSTRWDADGIDVAEWQAKYKSEDLPICPVEVIATPEDNAMGEKYFVERRDEFIAMMQKHGTIWFFGLCTSTIIHDSCISKSGNEQT